MGRLILLLLVGFIIEIAVWVGIAQFMSGWWIFLWTAIAFFVGLNLLRSSVANIMPQMQQMQMTGQMSNDPEVKSSLGKALAGFLLLMPGVISDVLAILVLLPPVQKALQGAIGGAMLKRQQTMMDQMMGSMGGMNGAGGGAGQADMMAEMMRRMQEMQQGASGNPRAGGHHPTIIDGEARHVEPEIKRIKPANDD